MPRYVVPIRKTIDGYAVVEATSKAEAREAAKDGDNWLDWDENVNVVEWHTTSGPVTEDEFE